MFELLIDKGIGGDGWAKIFGCESMEISAQFVREQLAAFPAGETELRIVIDSPGGEVFEGITIFNVIRDFVRSHPGVRTTAYVQGMAASMASMIALAAWSADPGRGTVQVEDNSVFMIHDAWDCTAGNRHALREAADFLEHIDSVLRDVYVRRTGRSDKEIGELMDAETWLFGREILDAGFADSVVEPEPAADGAAKRDGRDSSVLSAKARFDSAVAAVKKAAAATDRRSRIAAMASEFKGGVLPGSAAGNEPAAEKNIGGCMKITVDELKKDSPDVYAAVHSDGEAAGVRKEQARCARLLALGEKSGCQDYALECIKNGADPAENAVIDTFMERGVAAKVLAAQALDETQIPGVNPPKDSKDADDRAMAAAFDKGLRNGGYDDGDD